MPFDERLVVREQACVHLLAIGRPVEVQSRQIVTVTAQRPGQFVPLLTGVEAVLFITGRFVLHCHIFNHEDIGMMQLVEVSR